MPSVPYFAHQDNKVFQMSAHGGAEDHKVAVCGGPRPQQCPCIIRIVWNASGCIHAYNPYAAHVRNFRRVLKTVVDLPAFTNTLPVFVRAADLKLTILFQACCPESHYR
eukprot:1577074-Ditylum_brightwellii.AAC.1